MSKKEEMKQKIIELNEVEESALGAKRAVEDFKSDNRFICPTNVKNFGNSKPQKQVEEIPKPDLSCPTSKYMWGYAIGLILTGFIGSTIQSGSGSGTALILISFFATFRIGKYLKKQEQEAWENTDDYKQIVVNYEHALEEADKKAEAIYQADCKDYAEYRHCVETWQKDFDQRIRPYKDRFDSLLSKYRKLYKEISLPDPLKSKYYRNKILKMIDDVPSSLEFIIDIVMKEYLADKEKEHTQAAREAQRSYERSEQAARDAEQASRDAEDMYRESRDARTRHIAEGAILGYAFSQHRQKHNRN